jgi:paraquat-inducible protein A
VSFPQAGLPACLPRRVPEQGNAPIPGRKILSSLLLPAMPAYENDVVIPQAYPEQARWLRYGVWVAALLLVIGVLAPVITLNKFVLVHNTFSVATGIIALLREGQVFLFLLITGFSIVLPILKLWVLYGIVSKSAAMKARVRRQLHWMHRYGRWSMLDVFVVAVLVVAVKLGSLASVDMRYGLYAFAGSVLLTMLITSRIVTLSNQ